MKARSEDDLADDISTSDEQDRQSEGSSDECAETFACMTMHHHDLMSGWSAELPAAVSPSADSAIIFDWDDTLFPTWYITDVVWPCLTQEEREADIPIDSPFWTPLATHAKIVCATLRAARKAGNVAIVTLATREWLHSSVQRYLPGLKFNELVDELGIRIYYARSHVGRNHINPEEGVDMWVVAKRNAMIKCLKKFGRRATPLKNVLSVGDSLTEQQAIKEVIWEGDEDVLCKTVKLTVDPPVDHLMTELEVLSSLLGPMISHRCDFDIDMQKILSSGETPVALTSSFL